MPLPPPASPGSHPPAQAGGPDRETIQAIQSLIREQALASARDRLEDLLQTFPDDFWLQRTLVDVLIRMGDTYKAGPYLQRLLASHPEHPRVLLLAAERHRLDNRSVEATSLYLASLALQPDHYVRSRAVDGLLHQERFAEAEALVEEGLRQDPGDDWLLRKRARILSATDRKQEAAQLYARVASEKQGASPRDYVEGLKLRLDPLPPSERLKEVDKLLRLSSHRENAWLQLLAGELNLELGQRVEARQHLDLARSIHDGVASVGPLPASGPGGSPGATGTQGTIRSGGTTDFSLLKTLGYQYNRLEAFPEVLATLGRAFVHEPRELAAQQVLLKAAKRSGLLPDLRTLFVLAYEQHPGFHKLNGLIKKVDHLIESGG